MKKLWLFAIMWVSLLTLAGCATNPSQTQESVEQDLSAQVLEVLEPIVEVSEQEEIVEEVQEDTQWETYVEYSAADVDQALADGKKVALFFHASRCPSCRALEKEINENISQLPQDSVTFKVNYDKETNLKKQYGVTTQHTIVVIDENKDQTDKKSGSVDLAKLISMLQ